MMHGLHMYAWPVHACMHGADRNVSCMRQVCGLRWSPNGRELASGSNDEKLCIWGLHSSSPSHVFSDHTAAVKAIAWSPHKEGLLASGGGSKDYCIRFWNTATGSLLSSIHTGAALLC